MKIAAALGRIVGPEGVVTDPDLLERYREDWSGLRGCAPPLAVRPSCSSEVADVVRECRLRGQRIVIQGGRTGVVGSAVPVEGEIVLTLERMSRICEIDRDAGLAVVEAGAILQRVHDAAEAEGMAFPLDLGSRGSCTIGGNIATNAGGNRVLRFGMMRDLVVGIEGVLADGSVVDATRRMLKDNAGYDLRQLFIGSEGTLGIVTRAVLRLSPRPAVSAVAFCAARDYAAVMALWRAAHLGLAGDLCAFEVMWPGFYREVVASNRSLRTPFVADDVFHVLLETQGSSSDVTGRLEAALAAAHARGEILDVVVSQTAADASALWAIRDGVAELYAALKPARSFDISLPLACLGAYVDRTLRAIGTSWPARRVLTFGHLGDGNIHFLVSLGVEGDRDQDSLDELVYRELPALGGSISAEHGIGFVKRAWLQRSRDATDVALMRRLKKTVDPDNILGVGRIFMPNDAAEARDRP